MWLEIVAALFLVSEFVYHALSNNNITPTGEVPIPLTKDGSVIPLLYGRTRVKQPVLVYTSDPILTPLDTTGGGAPGNIYMLDMMFVLGVPFAGGRHKIFNAYAGDTRLFQIASGGGSWSFLSDLDGDGNVETSGGNLFPGRRPPAAVATSTFDEVTNTGLIEFLNGSEVQQLVDGSDAPLTQAAHYQQDVTAWFASGSPDPDQPWNYSYGLVDPARIPGYRGYLSVFLLNEIGRVHWSIGYQPSVAAYSYEVGSYPPFSDLGLIGDDCNPVDILLDLMTGPRKLGIDGSEIDYVSFNVAGVTLRTENHGYSRTFDQQQTFGDMITEILLQIAGGLYEDPSTGKIGLKLVRADFQPDTIPEINPTNCEALQNLAMGGWTGIPNRVVVTFINRQADYQDGTAIAYSQANAVGQDGEVIETNIPMPGVTNQDLADTIADRELQARSRPLMKCRAIVNRSFLRVLPGDAVKVVWPDANIAGIVFRVTGVSRGTLENGAIGLDLVQDYFFTHRNTPPEVVTGGVHADEIFHP